MISTFCLTKFDAGPTAAPWVLFAFCICNTMFGAKVLYPSLSLFPFFSCGVGGEVGAGGTESEGLGYFLDFNALFSISCNTKESCC